MDREALDRGLSRAFDPPVGERRVVIRAAMDLADAGRYGETHGEALAAAAVVSNLQDAPDGFGLVDRWNWWMGALELAHGGYEPFRVRRYREA